MKRKRGRKIRKNKEKARKYLKNQRRGQQHNSFRAPAKRQSRDDTIITFCPGGSERRFFVHGFLRVTCGVLLAHGCCCMTFDLSLTTIIAKGRGKYRFLPTFLFSESIRFGGIDNFLSFVKKIVLGTSAKIYLFLE